MSEKIVQLNEEVIKGQLKELVRGSVEEALNELLEADAEKLTQAARYERNKQRPVSYTHLDVYKRQILINTESVFFRIILDAFRKHKANSIRDWCYCFQILDNAIHIK